MMEDEDEEELFDEDEDEQIEDEGSAPFLLRINEEGKLDTVTPEQLQKEFIAKIRNELLDELKAEIENRKDWAISTNADDSIIAEQDWLLALLEEKKMELEAK